MHDEAQSGGDRARDQRGVLQWAEFEEMNVALECLPHVMRERGRNRGLADAARSSQRDEAVAQQTRRQLGQHVVPTDHPVQPMWQGRRRRRSFRCTRRECRSGVALATLHGRDEAIAAARDVGDVAGPVLAVAKHLAQLRDMDAQADLLDREAGPRVAENLVLRHHFAGTAEEQAQNIHRAAAELDRRSVPLEQPRPQRKRSERDCVEIKARPGAIAGRAMSCRGFGHF